MLFSSLEFLFLFLPVTVIVYFCVPSAWRNTVLLIFSLAFYGFGEPVYVLLVIFTVIADYAFGYFLGKPYTVRKRKTILAAAVVFNLSLLGFFKYYDFLAELFSGITGLSFIKPLGVTLPIGISFYTFQALSYVIDVYRRDVVPQKNIIDFGTYVSLFPQLIAGPIVRYSDIDLQLQSRTHSLNSAAGGLRTFCCGLAKKVLLANTAGAMWEALLQSGGGNETVLGAWLGIIFYAFQIYFDFSGYSDMAIGLGRIFGFTFPENFDYPYISSSVTEFWRRWHITLSSWFREYVYIPLGGNRRGKLRTYINLFIVWALTGLWHGAGAGFVLWGIYYFVLLSLEKAFLGKLLDRSPRAVGTVWTLIAVLFGWLIFVSDGSALTLKDGILYAGRMIGIGASSFSSGTVVYELVRSIPLLAVMAVASTPLPKKALYSLARKYPAAAVTANIFSFAVLTVCTAFLVASSYNPFLYFRF